MWPITNVNSVFLFQISDAVKEASKLGETPAWQTGLLIISFLSMGLFIAWVVRYLLNANTEARKEFLTSLEKAEDRQDKRNDQLRLMMERFADEIRRR